MTDFDGLMSSDQTVRAWRVLRSIPDEIDRAFEKVIKNLDQQ